MELARLAFVLAAASVLCACGGGSAPSSPGSAAPPPPAGTPTANAISIVGSTGPQSFNPNPVSLSVGQTIAWRNADTLEHHIVVDEGGPASGGGGGDSPGYSYGGGTSSGGAFDSGSVRPGSTSNAITVTSAGTLHYHCTIHPGMTGSIAVAP